MKTVTFYENNCGERDLFIHDGIKDSFEEFNEETIGKKIGLRIHRILGDGEIKRIKKDIEHKNEEIDRQLKIAKEMLFNSQFTGYEN